MTSYAFLGAPRTSQDLLGPQFPCRILLKIIVEIKDIQEILDTRQPWTRQRHQGRRVSRREAYPPGLRRRPPGNLLESGSALSGRGPELLYIKSASRDHTSILALVLKVNNAFH